MSEDVIDKKPLEADTAHAQDTPSPQGVWRPKQHARTGIGRRARQKLAKLASVPPKNRLFAERLQDAMTERDLSASELARRIWGATPDSRGGAKNRDRIGQYLNGATYPELESLQKLASAIGIPVEELTGNPGPTPGTHPPLVPAGNSDELILTALPAKPGRTRLRVNRELSWKLATHIHNLIRQAEEAELVGALAEETDINPDRGKVVGGTDMRNQTTK